MEGIKESLELMAGLEVLAKDYQKVMSDGKVDIKDLGVLADLMSQFGVLSDAVKGVDLIGKEVKDLSQEEIVALAGAAFALAKAFKKDA